LLGGQEALLERAITRSLGTWKHELRDEFAENDLLHHAFEELSSMPYLGWVTSGEALYVIVRTVQPSVVVETGVAAGLSSTCILAALERNAQGELHSIDLPNHEEQYCPGLGLRPIAVLPEDKPTGFLIPETLRARWHLYIGNTRDRLPSLITELGRLDIFVHDSEHTYGTMTFEYEAAWSHLRPGGFLISHDVNWNNAFRDFCKRHDVKPTYFWRVGLGAVRK
jgi:hypothetical protein